MARHSSFLPDPLQAYLRTHVSEPPALAACRERTAGMPTAKMQISPEQGQFMAVLLKSLGACHVLELGTFTGYSALVMALALPKDGTVTTLDKNPEWTKQAQATWDAAGVSDKIQLILGPALDSLNILLNTHLAHFDMIFIDADKLNYPAYYEHALKLVKPGGLIAIDNTLWQGKVWDETLQDETTACMRHFNETVFEDDRVAVSLVPIGDGLTLAYKREQSE